MVHLTTRRLFAILIFLGLLIMTTRPVADPDFWWHLQTGKLIAESGVIPHVDPFSFTLTGSNWITHEWLTELLIFQLFKIGSFPLLIVIFSILISSAFLLAYFQSNAKPYIAGFITIFSALATAPTWGVRPQMITLTFSSVFLYILDRTRLNSQWKNLLLLPLITLLWVNLHGGYILGLAIIGLHIFGEMVDLVLANIHQEQFSNRRFFRLVAIFLLCIIAALVNPNFYKILIYPFETLSSPSMMTFIQEWFSPDFHQVEWIPLALLFISLIAAPSLSRRPVHVTNILLVTFFGFFALRSMRNVPIFAISAIPFLSDQLSGISFRQKTNVVIGQISKWLNPVLLILALLVAGINYLTISRQQGDVIAVTYPKVAVDWISTNQPDGNIFNSYGWGGYLIWRLFPDYKVFIDGRADIYGDEFINNYLSIYSGQSGWEESLSKWGVKIVLLEPQSGLAGEIRRSDNWIIVYEDRLSVLFTTK